MVPKKKNCGNVMMAERCMVRAMCEVQLKEIKRSMDLMLGLGETLDQLAMVNSVCLYGHV